MMWQPIDTAPMDGRKFLGWVDEDWVEGFRIVGGEFYYTSDGDGLDYPDAPLNSGLIGRSRLSNEF